jgi:hypothetical protein
LFTVKAIAGLLPVAPAESRTLTTTVFVPFVPFVVTQGIDAGRSLLVPVKTELPSATIVYVLLPAAALSTQTVNHTTPLTVWPGLGAVTPTVSVPPPPPPAFCTVTEMLRKPELPAPSLTVAVRVVAPLGELVVIHGRLTGPLELSDVDATVCPPAVSV